MKKRIEVVLFFLLCLLITSFPVAGQSIKEFPSEQDLFLPELNKFMGTNLNENQQAILINFGSLWLSGTYDLEEKNKIINLSNLLLKRRARANPNFLEFLTSLSAFKQTEGNQENFAPWYNGLVELLINKNFTLGDIRRYFNITKGVMEAGVLYTSSANEWKIRSGEYRFLFDSTLKIIFKKSDLVCYAQRDSGIIYQTQGTLFPDRAVWIGEGGIVSWERAGFDKTRVYAELQNYQIDLGHPYYSADSVLFYHHIYLDKPLKGNLEERIRAIPSPNMATFPRFNSYTKRILIVNMFDNINFEGGISMNGSKLNGSGDKYKNASLSIFKNDTLLLNIKSEYIVFSKDRIASKKAIATIYLEEDSIFHPGIAFNYQVSNKEITLYRTNDKLTHSPYFNSYHNLDMEFEMFSWKIEDPKIKMTMSRGASLGHARFESISYYNENEFHRIQGIDNHHPLFTLKKFAKWYYSETFPVDELAKWMNKPPYQIKQLCVRLSIDGFIYYDQNTGEVTIKKRLYDFIDAFAGEIDFDVIGFVSNTGAPLENATLDLNTNNLTINGVSQIFLSDFQNVIIWPRNEQIILGKNRNFDFDGKIIAGLFTFFGENFKFKYDSFKINLHNLDSMQLSIQTDTSNIYGDALLTEIKNTIEMITGELLIDHPSNKSGYYQFPEYPILHSMSNSFVYYDHISGLDSTYSRDDFYFELEPYTINNLDRFKKEDVQFKGKFSSSIFPEISQTLTVQEDNSLGFSHPTSAEGLPAYKGKGFFYNNIKLSNKGLKGEGKLHYLSSVAESDDFIFYPDSMFAEAQTFSINKQETGVKFPELSADNIRIKWYPNKDEWIAQSTENDFSLFDDKMKLKGSVTLKPDGLLGSGRIDLPDAILTSDNYLFTEKSFDTDTTNFRLKSRKTDGYAFIADNVSAHIDLSINSGLFASNSDTTDMIFPENQIATSLDYFVWNMNVKELAMGNISPYYADARIEKPTLVSINPKKDSLGFVTDSAVYNLEENLITAYEVNFIEIADAMIFPDGGIVKIENKSRIRTLEDAKILANNRFVIEPASVNIHDNNNYTGSGLFNYIDQNENLQPIRFNSITVNEEKVTVGYGTIEENDDFKLSPYFRFIGDVNINAIKDYLTFTGGVQIEHQCAGIAQNYLQFTSEINPENVLIPVSSNSRNSDGRRIFNGLYITEDSTHIYQTFMGGRKDYSDNLITQAEGYLYYDEGSDNYKIGSLEKLTDENLPGNLLSFDKNYCNLYGEGALDLAVEYGQVKITIVGNTLHESESELTTMNVMLGFDFFFSDEAMMVMANDIFVIPTLEPVDMTTGQYKKGMRELIGTEQANSLSQESSLFGIMAELPEGIRKYRMLLTDVKLKWNQETSSYRSVGKIGIGNIMNKQLNVKTEGYLEIQKKKSGDMFDLYLKLDDETWYYFAYTRGVMQALSNNHSFTDPIQALKTGQRRLDVRSGKTSYIYMLSVDRKLQMFLRRFRLYENDDEEE
jgi:hypothetical protein